jgi:hypothetical protein
MNQEAMLTLRDAAGRRLDNSGKRCNINLQGCRRTRTHSFFHRRPNMNVPQETQHER